MSLDLHDKCCGLPLHQAGDINWAFHGSGQPFRTFAVVVNLPDLGRSQIIWQVDINCGRNVALEAILDVGNISSREHSVWIGWAGALFPAALVKQSLCRVGGRRWDRPSSALHTLRARRVLLLSPLGGSHRSAV